MLIPEDVLDEHKMNQRNMTFRHSPSFYAPGPKARQSPTQQVRNPQVHDFGKQGSNGQVSRLNVKRHGTKLHYR